MREPTGIAARRSGKREKVVRSVAPPACTVRNSGSYCTWTTVPAPLVSAAGLSGDSASKGATAPLVPRARVLSWPVG